MPKHLQQEILPKTVLSGLSHHKHAPTMTEMQITRQGRKTEERKYRARKLLIRPMDIRWISGRYPTGERVMTRFHQLIDKFNLIKHIYWKKIDKTVKVQ